MHGVQAKSPFFRYLSATILETILESTLKKVQLKKYNQRVYDVQARSFRPDCFRPTFIGLERRKNWA
jgi:hypothetical protein